MRILLVEDDYLEAGQIRDLLTEHYLNVDLIDVSTEVGFIEVLPALEESPPDLVIMDVMIPWQGRSASLVAPPEEEPRSALNAGIRLLAKLQESHRLKSVPVIIHSARAWHDVESDLATMPDHVMFVHKGSAPLELMVVLRALMGALGRLPEDRVASLPRRIWEAVEASPGLGGFGVDLKKLIVRGRKAG